MDKITCLLQVWATDISIGMCFMLQHLTRCRNSWYYAVSQLDTYSVDKVDLFHNN
jgi:hypothetical protein